jgi:hypothetical protein
MKGATRLKKPIPDLKRNVSGYDLDMLIEDARKGSANLARLLAGSEGTLAIVTKRPSRSNPFPRRKLSAC